MSGPARSSLERVVAALSHKEPDRVRLLLLLTMCGARELGLGLREYVTDFRAIVALPVMQLGFARNGTYPPTWVGAEGQ